MRLARSAWRLAALRAALLAIVCQVLLPGLASAPARGGAMPVCTGLGIVYVDPSTSGAPDKPTGHDRPACPCCLAGCLPLAISPPFVLPALPARAETAPFAARAHAPVGARCILAARPRAPPPAA